jgi:uncharacterized protein with PIN domain
MTLCQIRSTTKTACQHDCGYLSSHGDRIARATLGSPSSTSDQSTRIIDVLWDIARAHDCSPLHKGLSAEVEALLTHLDLDNVPVNRVLALKGIESYQRYGKGGSHPAQLNDGDCFAAAAATIYKMPLLSAGKNLQAAGF